MSKFLNYTQNYPESQMILPKVHKRRYIACPPYKTELAQKFERLFLSYYTELHKAYVNKNKKAHRRARKALSEIMKVAVPLRQELLDNRNAIGPIMITEEEQDAFDQRLFEKKH